MWRPLASAGRDSLELLGTRRRVLRRARVLRDLGDALVFARPPGWQARARRAYHRVTTLVVPQGTAAVAARVEEDADVQARAARAHAALREARRPFTRFWWALAVRLGGVGFAVLVVVSLVLALSKPLRARLFPPNIAANARWTASSAYPGTPASGDKPSSSEAYFVHTNAELSPWVRIDLPRVARLRSIRIENRSDCCAERALPLSIEVPEGDGWRLLCQRRATFSSWTCHPPPTTTSTLRVVAGGGTLHLKQIAAYE